MARQIGKMLNAREPKIVNGPEILNKYVGESEANIRKLFADAEEEQKRVREAVPWAKCSLTCDIRRKKLKTNKDVTPALYCAADVS